MVAAEVLSSPTHGGLSTSSVGARVLAFLLQLLAATTSLPASGSCEPMVTSNGVYSKAAVATDAGVCSEIGISILKKGGSAVDAAISSSLCGGLVNLHSTGIGGGGFMLVYQAATQQMHAVDFREVAPMAASYNMYEGLEPTASAVGEFLYGMVSD